MIEIDGSFGEGGGQILRSSLSLSLVTGRPFRIGNIRAGRERPGLLRQHLTAVTAAVEISGARVTGAALGSTALTFEPVREVRAGEYKFAIGTAGSGTLVLQTLLPALMLANAPSRITIEGGTHNQAAPPFDFLAKTFAPLVERMGPGLKLQLQRYGFYPAGGGRFTAEIEPVNGPLRQLHLAPAARGEITHRKIHALVANLPRDIAFREVQTASEILGWGRETWDAQQTRDSAGPGNVLIIEVGDGNVTELFTAFGKQGLPAEEVARAAAEEAAAYLSTTAVIGKHLCDQLLLPIALAGGGSFTTVPLSLHSRTNMLVIREFLPGAHFETTEIQTGGEVRVSYSPS